MRRSGFTSSDALQAKALRGAGLGFPRDSKGQSIVNGKIPFAMMERVRTLCCRSESFVPIVGSVPLCETRRHWLSAVIPDGQPGQASGEHAPKDHAEIAVAEQVDRKSTPLNYSH